MTLESKACYLRTIRYYVAYSLMNKFPLSLAITDIDSLIVSPSFSDDFSDFLIKLPFVIGARSDISTRPLHEVASTAIFSELSKLVF